ncbi:PREDICTED: craniofacial development protein 2-like [Nicotiana attenuata]|uniref:craniofacial development protein 2-like n=1 Tax=Nicotiana attenuata TaxID=49451 RepID=UPI000905B1F2|nr:PREDICTED: craniofacial development protein 2-like [Nicotiana attenuata]
MSLDGVGGRAGAGGKGAYRLRIGSWNIGTLTGRSIELEKILQKRKVNIACIQETRWVGSKAKNAYVFKLWYSGRSKDKNGVAILVDRDLRETMVEVRRVKRCFWEGLDEVVHGIPPTEKLFIGGDFNGHIGASAIGYGEVHGRFGFGVRNGGGTSLLDFAKAFELMISNSSFSKRQEHLVIFQSMVARTQIDYLLLWRCDRGLCKNCKVIPVRHLRLSTRLGDGHRHRDKEEE